MTAEALEYTVYSLALPRPPEQTGRTADWNTLAAVYAASGKAQLARAALFVTLAIAPDIQKRCSAAVDAARTPYGPVLREATEAMFVRIRNEKLSEAPECALPISW